MKRTGKTSKRTNSHLLVVSYTCARELESGLRDEFWVSTGIQACCFEQLHRLTERFYSMTSRNSRSQYLFYKQESQIRFISVVVKDMHKFIFKSLIFHVKLVKI